MTRLLMSGALLTALLATACASGHAYLEARGKDAAMMSLENVYAELKRSYYDREFHGQDMAMHYQSARSEIHAAATEQQRYRAISNFMRQLDDLHTGFVGYQAVELADYGFSLRFYGDSPFVSAVDAWTSADSVGLRRGDEILKFAGRTLTRANQFRVIDDFLARHPIPALELEVRAPNRSISQLEIRADTAALRKMAGQQFRQLRSAARDSAKRASQHVQSSIHNHVFFWKLPHFASADRGLGKVVGRARKHEILILDLRGNYGGVIKTLEKLVGYFTDDPVEVGTLHMRWDTKRFHAKPKADRFTGKLFILVDSETASAAEVFARIMQISGRAKVIGDRTMGAVMASMHWEFEVGDGWWSGASITVSDFVLHNGERLEKIGVEPDVKIMPTAQDIAAGVDPVLAYALKETGIPMTSAQAARLITGK